MNLKILEDYSESLKCLMMALINYISKGFPRPVSLYQRLQCIQDGQVKLIFPSSFIYTKYPLSNGFFGIIFGVVTHKNNPVSHTTFLTKFFYSILLSLFLPFLYLLAEIT